MATLILSPLSPDYTMIYNWKKIRFDQELYIMINEKHLSMYKNFDFFKSLKFFSVTNWSPNNIYKVFREEIPLQNVNNIFSYDEHDVEIAAKMRDYLGIPGQKTLSSLIFRNKYFMTKHATDSDIKTPLFQKVVDLLDIYSFIDKHGLPVILKPLTDSGGKKVHKIFTKSDVDKLNKLNLNHQYLIESYINYPLYHVDGLWTKEKKLRFLSISKYLGNGGLNYQSSKSSGSFQISTTNKFYIPIEKYTRKLLQSYNNNFSTLFHLDIFVNPSNPSDIIFCEIGSRLGGGRIHIILKEQLGLWPLNILFSEQINNFNMLSDSTRYLPPKETLMGFVLVIPFPGKISKINKNIPFDFIVNVKWFANVGDSYGNSKSVSEAVCAIVVKGNSEQQVEQNISIANDWVHKNITLTTIDD